MKLPSIQSSFLIHLVATYLLLGISFVVQLISYPLFKSIPESAYVDYHQEYLIRISILVTPISIVEFLTGLYLLMKVGDFKLHSLLRSGFALILTILAVTLLFDIPSQISLLSGFSQSAFSTILFANFFRLIFGVFRAILVTKMIKYIYSYDTAYSYEEFT